ncbi:MAG: 2Fe-2S ferredoxin [Tardiphaga sp.]|nr:2Fe-2S ferredoxin [Tardiphaga sp.]
MPTIIFVEPDGNRRAVIAKSGESAMQAATRNGIVGIIGECGGSCMCATCHCYVDAGSASLLEPAADIERETLEFVARHARADSRLACQIMLTDSHDGLVLQVVGA